MGRNGVQVNRLNGGLGRRNASSDGVCLLVIGGAVATSKLALKTALQVISPDEAEAVGITPSYDDTNKVLAHHHIDEFFGVNPNGNLFVMLDDGSLTNAELKAVLKEQSQIKAAGFVRNASAAPADFEAYVGGFQTMLDELKAESRNVSSVLVEGSVFDNATLISAYPDARTYESEKVSVVIVQDPIIRALKPEYETYAAVGAALGAISVRKVNENIGSLDIERKPSASRGSRTYPLTNTARKRWLNAVLQDGKDVNTLSATELNALDDKGYIYAINYNGFAGYYFSDSHTCTESASDYSRIENNRVWDKGADIVRTALLPRIKANLLTDPDTGFIREVEAKELEVIADKALTPMVADEEISGKSVYINPEQDLSDGKPLKIKGQLAFNNIIHDMEFDLGLTNKLQ